MRRVFIIALILSLMVTLFPINVSALAQDPVILSIDNLTYGEGQNTLIAKGFFINTSDKTVLSIADVTLEISSGQQIIASAVFNITEKKVLSIAPGDSEPWEFVFKAPLKGMNLSNTSSEHRITYNLGKPQVLPAGKKVYYNGLFIDFDVKPAVIGGRLMIPARAVFEKMGGTVTWNDASKSLEVFRNGRQVIIGIDNPNMTVDGKPVKLDVPATIINGRTLVPLRAISNALGARVVYGDQNEMAVIYE